MNVELAQATRVDQLQLMLWAPATREQLNAARERMERKGATGIVKVGVCCRICNEELTGWSLIGQVAHIDSHGIFDRMRRAWIRQFGSRRLAERRNLT